MPATSQLDWLISMTAMIVLFWSRATRDLLKSFGWASLALHRLVAATKLPFLATRPIASLGPAVGGEVVPWRTTRVFARDRRRHRLFADCQPAQRGSRNRGSRGRHWGVGGNPPTRSEGHKWRQPAGSAPIRHRGE